MDIAQANPFSALVGKQRDRRDARDTRSGVERFVLSSDDRAFLFEDRDSEARLQFLCAENIERIDCVIDPEGPTPEIYVLAPTRAPRGDIVYRDSNGDLRLRITAYGGATVFWPGEQNGQAAFKSFGETHALQLVFEPRETAQRRAATASAVLSALTGAPLLFDIGRDAGGEGDSHAVLADAVVTAAKGIEIVADDPTGARIFASRIGKVAFIAADAPGLALNERVLEVRYVPGGDLAGRPASGEVARFLEANL